MRDRQKISRRATTNVDVSEVYDAEDDTYYVTFKTGEPSYVVEVDDVLLLEVGVFTDLPTGFRILNFEKSGVKRVGLNVVIQRVEESLSRLLPPSRDERKVQFKRALGKVLA